MSKKKKKKDVDTDYVLFLMNDGTMRSIHRSDIYDEYEETEVDFILIPLADGLQYIIVSVLPKRFEEFHISFDLYLMNSTALYENTRKSYLDSHMLDDPVYEKLMTYNIECRDAVDYFRFLQSFLMTTGITETFKDVTDLGYSDDFTYFNTLCWDIVHPRYTIVSKKGTVKSGAFLDDDGVQKRGYTPDEFIKSLVNVVYSSKSKKNSSMQLFHQGMVCSDSWEDAFIIDIVNKSWTMVPELYCDYVIEILESIDNGKRVSVYSELTHTFIFESPEVIEMYGGLDWFDVSFGVFYYVSDLNGVHSDSLPEVLMNFGVDYASTFLTLRNLVLGEISNYFDYCYTANKTTSNNFEAMVVLVNMERLLSLIRMINDILFPEGAIIVFQVSGSVDCGHYTFTESTDIGYLTICEDINLIHMHDRSPYERFTEDVRYVWNDKLPPRFEGHDLPTMMELPIELPF